MQQKTLIVLVGPTGIGKTELSLSLAKLLSSPIVSADSRQIYKTISIGTAAPTEKQLSQAKHYFVKQLELDEYYSAAQYEKEVLVLLDELFKTHHTVLMTGGSMMYIDAVCKGLDDIADVPDSIRHEVRAQYEAQGLEWLQEQVKQHDPAYWAEVDQQNPQRLMHCLEICRVSGKPYSSFRRGGEEAMRRQAERGFDVEYIMVERPRAELYERINDRVHKMVEAGLLDEARQAFEQ